MCAAPAVALAITLRVLAEAAGRRRPRWSSRSAPVGEPRRPRGRARVRPRLRRRHVRPRARPGRRAGGAGGRRGRAAPQPGGAASSPRTSWRCASGSPRSGVPCPRWAQVRDAASLKAFGDEVGWPVVVKTPARRLRRQGRARRRVRRRGRPTGWSRGRHAAADGPLADGLLARGAGGLRPRARRARRAQPVRAGGRVAGRRDRADRRHLHRGARPGAGPRRRTSPPQATEAGAADRRGRSASPACWRSSCSRCATRGAATRRTRQRAGHAAAQQRALDASTARSPASSSSTCGPCSTCRWATRAARRRGR